MSQVKLTDSFSLGGSTRTITDEGYLKATAALTCVGVQKYALADFTGNAEDANKVVNAYRPAATVFAKDTMESAKLRPVTMLHPDEKVTSENYQHYSVGTLGENVYQLDDHRLAATILINHKAVVKQLQDGVINHLSMGYQAEVKAQSGTFEGKAYEYIFEGPMHINHCAIVPKGRCGANATILDQANKTDEDNMKTEKKEQKEPTKQPATKATEPATKPDETKGKADAQGKPTEESKPATKPAGQMKQDAGNTQTVNVQDAVAERMALLEKVKPFVKDIAELHGLTNHQILQKIFTKDGCQDKSNDYLMGRLDESIKQGKTSAKTLSHFEQQGETTSLSFDDQEMLSVVDMLKLKRKAG